MSYTDCSSSMISPRSYRFPRLTRRDLFLQPLHPVAFQHVKIFTTTIKKWWIMQNCAIILNSSPHGPTHRSPLTFCSALLENAICFSVRNCSQGKNWLPQVVVPRRRQKNLALRDKTFVIFQSECKCGGAYILWHFITNFTWRVGPR